MLQQHAEKHLDKIIFPVNKGQDYILERGKYTKMAYGRLQNNWQNAEDAVQEAYLSILEYPPYLAMSREAFEAYFTVVLLGIVSRMYRNERNQEMSHVTPAGKFLQYLEVEESDEDKAFREEVISLADEEVNPESTAMATEMLATITAEVNKMKFKFRTIAALSTLYGYKPREIVEITGYKPTMVYNTIKNFRRHMEGML